MRLTKPASAVLATLAVAAVVVYPADKEASASTVPFADTNAHGSIGLCNKSGDSVTSGSLLDDPFVWKAVSSTPVPNGYSHGKATLYVFQPRVNIPAAEWSGEQVTGGSSFTNPNHPMAQATSGDPPLLSVDGAFPPEWDGLYQLRMYFTGVNLEPYTETYPATVIRVSGNKWSVVDGGSAACNSGSAASSEVAALNNPSLATPQPVAVTRGTIHSAGSAHASGAQSGLQTPTKAGVQSSSSGPASGPGRSSEASAQSASEPVGAKGSDKGMKGGTIVGLVLIASAVLAGGSAGVTLRRRRTAGQTGDGLLPTAP